jgi:hypothetical protein
MSTKTHKRLTDAQFKKRAAEVVRQEMNEPERWHYVSFAGESSFRGAVIIEAHGITDALLKINGLKLNPHGEVLCIPLDEVPEEKWRNRLLTKEDVLTMWPDAKSVGELEEETT